MVRDRDGDGVGWNPTLALSQHCLAGVLVSTGGNAGNCCPPPGSPMPRSVNPKSVNTHANTASPGHQKLLAWPSTHMPLSLSCQPPGDAPQKLADSREHCPHSTRGVAACCWLKSLNSQVREATFMAAALTCLTSSPARLKCSCARYGKREEPHGGCRCDVLQIPLGEPGVLQVCPATLRLIGDHQHGRQGLTADKWQARDRPGIILPHE